MGEGAVPEGRARVYALGAAGAGLGSAVLVVLLGHPVLADLMREGSAFLSWVCAAFLSLCYLGAVLALLAYVLLGWGWCPLAWLVAGIYMTTLVASFSARAETHGGSLTVVLFSLYCTSIPFQFAGVVRRCVRGARKAPTGPGLVDRLLLPRARAEVHDVRERLEERLLKR
ncbi:hypothetical protein [Actinocorallia lasiicapitis]